MILSPYLSLTSLSLSHSLLPYSHTNRNLLTHTYKQKVSLATNLELTHMHSHHTHQDPYIHSSNTKLRNQSIYLPLIAAYTTTCSVSSIQTTTMVQRQACMQYILHAYLPTAPTSLSSYIKTAVLLLLLLDAHCYYSHSYKEGFLHLLYFAMQHTTQNIPTLNALLHCSKTTLLQYFAGVSALHSGQGMMSVLQSLLVWRFRRLFLYCYSSTCLFTPRNTGLAGFFQLIGILY